MSIRGYIYKIIAGDEFYIGSTCDLVNRHDRHMFDLRNGGKKVHPASKKVQDPERARAILARKKLLRRLQQIALSKRNPKCKRLIR